MELRKLIMLGVASLGVAGTTAVALSGQSAFTGPETFATGNSVSKEKTLTASTAPTITRGDGDVGEGHFEGGYCDGGTTSHTAIDVSYSNYYSESMTCDWNDVSNNYLLKTDNYSDDDSFDICFGVNGVTRVEVTYSATGESNFWYSVGYEDIYFIEGDFDVDNDGEKHTTDLFNYDGSSGTANAFQFCIHDAGATIYSMKIYWSC